MSLKKMKPWCDDSFLFWHGYRKCHPIALIPMAIFCLYPYSIAPLFIPGVINKQLFTRCDGAKPLLYGPIIPVDCGGIFIRNHNALNKQAFVLGLHTSYDRLGIFRVHLEIVNYSQTLGRHNQESGVARIALFLTSNGWCIPGINLTQ